MIKGELLTITGAQQVSTQQSWIDQDACHLTKMNQRGKGLPRRLLLTAVFISTLAELKVSSK